jgi:hypothetical protein
MRRIGLAALGAAAAMVLPPAGAGAQVAPGEPTIFAAGTTPLTNGIFFPGTAFYDSAKREFQTVGPPLTVPRGENVQFANLDVAAAANSHRIRSVKVKKSGKPLFQSKDVAGPDVAVVKTKKLKPGTYYYLCTTHSGMFGVIEVTES